MDENTPKWVRYPHLDSYFDVVDAFSRKEFMEKLHSPPSPEVLERARQSYVKFAEAVEVELPPELITDEGLIVQLELRSWQVSPLGVIREWRISHADENGGDPIIAEIIGEDDGDDEPSAGLPFGNRDGQKPN